ncbi:hypothetical protein HMPREF1250_0183 [Megasphaera vaginalis (ex Srinivasan et al. 2021)]|uniref:Uncharacterized protein n=1 Tax=Megasphaera vaginalis (ex Srinivasan et al. 2021) TaxID=1111454 RepID=U7UJ71_9FIRM|nr:hypothetical protein HMPREF1250_0183 [Megasphaera vaginalis (ex Srinivasan et al. 2021)]
MYKLLIRYVNQFGKDFPVLSVKDKSEYEICRIVRECCERNTVYTETPVTSLGT